MYMGTKIAVCLSTDVYKQKAQDVQYFLKCVQEFYIEAASQIRNWFPTLCPLAARFPNILPESQLEVHDNQ